MTKDEALKLALEALEYPLNQSHENFNVDMAELISHRAITAIKEALAQPEQEPNKDGSPCSEFWDWLPKAYNFEGDGNFTKYNMEVAFLAGKQAAQPEQEPVAWLITDENINSIQIASIQRLIDRARHAHMTDIKLRINGQDEWHQADWLKHLTRTTPPSNSMNSIKSSNTLDAHRKPLTDKEIGEIAGETLDPWSCARAIEAAHGIKGEA